MPQQDKQFTLSALYGNETLKQQLCHILARDQLAHAYVLQGDTGSGRRTLATQLAMALCCQANSGTVPCQTCSTCRKILQGIYTDLRYIAPRDGRKTISIDQIRQMREDVFIHANDGIYKIYIIAPAEAMTEEAQNAFLKVLEEPAKGVYFFLILSNGKRLLPTVVSRIQTLHLQQFDTETLQSYLMQHVPAAQECRQKSPSLFAQLIHIANGSIGRAKRYLEQTDKERYTDDDFVAYQAAQKLIEQFTVMRNTCSAPLFDHVISECAITTVLRAQRLALVLADAVSDMLRIKKSTKTDQPLLFFTNFDAAMQAAQQFTAVQLARKLSALISCASRGQENPNLTLYLLQIFRILSSQHLQERDLI